MDTAIKHGILLYLTERIKNGWHTYTIKAVVNPRKVLDPDASYLVIVSADSDSLERFQNEAEDLIDHETWSSLPDGVLRLELLEDDSTAVKLKSDGTIEY